MWLHFFTVLWSLIVFRTELFLSFKKMSLFGRICPQALPLNSHLLLGSWDCDVECKLLSILIFFSHWTFQHLSTAILGKLGWPFSSWVWPWWFPWNRVEGFKVTGLDCAVAFYVQFSPLVGLRQKRVCVTFRRNIYRKTKFPDQILEIILLLKGYKWIGQRPAVRLG